MSQVSGTIESMPPLPKQVIETLREAIDEIFATMLDTVAVLVDSGAAPDATEMGVETPVGMQAVVEIHGGRSGAVVLRCCTDGANFIARDFLKLADHEAVCAEDVEDALGECANMVTGMLKNRAFAGGDLLLGLPRIDAYSDSGATSWCGALVYRLAMGRVSAEVWLD